MCLPHLCNYIDYFSLGYCFLLKPFHWENILIPIIPNSCMELLEAPVPCITGLKKSAYTFDRSTFTQETVVVLLDKNEVLHYTGDEGATLQNLPKLSDLKASITKPYKLFNKNLLSNYLITNEMKKAVEEITTNIEAKINKAVLNYLPLIPPRTANKEVDLEKVKRMLLGCVKPVDESFVKLLCETQMFASYVDELNKERLSIIDYKY